MYHIKLTQNTAILYVVIIIFFLQAGTVSPKRPKPKLCFAFSNLFITDMYKDTSKIISINRKQVDVETLFT